MIAVKWIITFIVMLLAAISDAKTRTVDDKCAIAIAVASFIGARVVDIPLIIIEGIAVLAFLLLIATSKGIGGIGGADIKICSAFTCVAGLCRSAFALTIGLAIALIYMKITKEKKCAFIPCYLVGVITSLII